MRSLHDFIAHDSPHYARKVIQDIVARTEVLDEFPRIGKVVPELDTETIRELSMHAWRILYEIRDPDIVILAIIHKRRNFKPNSL